MIVLLNPCFLKFLFVEIPRYTLMFQQVQGIIQLVTPLFRVAALGNTNGHGQRSMSRMIFTTQVITVSIVLKVTQTKQGTLFY